MVKAIAINGSPRKSWNTATLLNRALAGAKAAGADTELVHLYSLPYKGCTSCFACKRKDGRWRGRCAMQDGLTSVLEKCMHSDLLLLGSPIYLGDVTGAMRSFLERMVFMNLSYEAENRSNFEGKINLGWIYTMNIPAAHVEDYGYPYIFNSHLQYAQVFHGTAENLIATDTCQFDDYTKYAASKYDERHKAQYKATQFPKDCEKAYLMGMRLAQAK